MREPNLPTDPEANRERFATSRRQPHEIREGRTFHPVSIGRTESRPSCWLVGVLFRPPVVFAKDGLSCLFFLHARHVTRRHSPQLLLGLNAKYRRNEICPQQVGPEDHKHEPHENR